MADKPELLCPAGDDERLDMALHYGADAVYLAGKEFGLRASAGNFGPDELRAAVGKSHAAGAKAYVTINTLPHEGGLSALPQFLEETADAGADGYIIADLGVMSLAKKYAPAVPIHVSTQLGVINSETARVLYDMGASRVVLAREMTLDEIAALRAHAPGGLELETFVHGAMCVSFSGRCLLSNYMAGRDANGGLCAQPCRWNYYLVEEKRPGQFFEISEDGGTHIMNSNDMCMIEHIPELCEAGIASFKIEGRMKSAYYAAATANAYRHAIDEYYAGAPFDRIWLEECMKVSHRPYCTGFYLGEPGQFCGEKMYFSEAEICAVVESCGSDGNAVLTQRNRFFTGDSVELLTRNGKPVRFTVGELCDGEGTPISAAPHPMMTVRMKLPAAAERLSILRKIK